MRVSCRLVVGGPGWLRRTVPVMLALSNLHCGSTGKQPAAAAGSPPAGAAGASSDGAPGAGGATAGSGGAGASGSAGTEAQGGSSLDPVAARAACQAAVEAQCARQVECFPEELGPDYLSLCVDVKAQCPARLLAPGTGYTVDQLNACTQEWPAFSCDALAASERPACTQPGIREVGEPCRFRNQCASGVCSSQDPVTCGVCVPVVESGAACVHWGQCPAHHLCSFGHCLQLQDWAEQLAEGEPCSYIGNCLGLCAETPDGSRCVPAPALGEPCLPPPPVAGARRCGGGGGQQCSPEGLCVNTPSSGPCAEGIRPCVGNMYCTGPGGLAPGECVEFLQPGSACDPMVIGMCGENGSCVCDDAACSAHHCDIYLRKGDACGAGRVCGAGHACVSGTCELIAEPYEPADCP